MTEAEKQSRLYQIVQNLERKAWPVGVMFNSKANWGDVLWYDERTNMGLPSHIVEIAFEASTAEHLLRQDHIVKVWSPVDKLVGSERIPELYVVALDDEDVDEARMYPSKIEALVAKCMEVE